MCGIPHNRTGYYLINCCRYNIGGCKWLVAFAGFCVRAIGELWVYPVGRPSELMLWDLWMGANRASFCQVTHLAASAADSAGRWAVLGHMPFTCRSTGVAMPRAIRRMADPATGGSILEVFEFILS